MLPVQWCRITAPESYLCLMPGVEASNFVGRNRITTGKEMSSLGTPSFRSQIGA
jgi:hypothetical protein